jgi:ABC-2 type transport system ATP-binding protein
MIPAVRQLSGHAIAVRSLERAFGPRQVLDGIDLTVSTGEVRGLLGPQGAGKTTLLRVLAGQLHATGGHVRVLGRLPGAKSLNGCVGYAGPGGDAAYQRISGFENLAFFARTHGLETRAAYARASAVLDEAGLTAAAHDPVGEWTPQMRRALDVARALLTRPRVLLLDAPQDGAEPESTHRVVTAEAERGTAVLWAARRLDELEHIAPTVTLLAAGRVRYAGSVAGLAAAARRAA